jgi:glycosyltransferase involved in cell wall biosynthesis
MQKLSILIPVYNEAQTIAEVIVLISQLELRGGIEKEIIVINDCSSDSTAAEIYTRQGIQVSVGYENDDFSKNMVTVIAEWRGLCVVKANHAGGFVKGTFATDIAAILKP